MSMKQKQNAGRTVTVNHTDHSVPVVNLEVEEETLSREEEQAIIEHENPPKIWRCNCDNPNTKKKVTALIGEVKDVNNPNIGREFATCLSKSCGFFEYTDGNPHIEWNRRIGSKPARENPDLVKELVRRVENLEAEVDSMKKRNKPYNGGTASRFNPL